MNLHVGQQVGHVEQSIAATVGVQRALLGSLGGLLDHPSDDPGDLAAPVAPTLKVLMLPDVRLYPTTDHRPVPTCDGRAAVATDSAVLVDVDRARLGDDLLRAGGYGDSTHLGLLVSPG